MRRAKIDVAAVSPLYVTAAVGRASQPPYVNAVALLDTSLSPEALLRVLKGIERRSAGREALGQAYTRSRYSRLRRPGEALAGPPVTLCARRSAASHSAASARPS